MPHPSQFSDEDAEMRGSVAKQVFSLLLSLGLSDGFKIVSTSQTEKVVNGKRVFTNNVSMSGSPAGGHSDAGLQSRQLLGILQLGSQTAKV